MYKKIFSVLVLVSSNLFSQNLPLSKIKVIGSHNSYKKAMKPEVYQMLLEKTNEVTSLEYEHIAIEDQLKLGLRNLEIDIWKDSKGGKYHNPKSIEISNSDYEWSKEMMLPGYKVFHMPDYDCETHQPSFIKNLDNLKKWSDENPNHETVFITLELKDSNKDKTTKFDYNDVVEINNLIKNKLGENKLISPHELKREKGKVIWPAIDQSKGKFVWIIDNTDYRLDLFDKIDSKDSYVFLNVSDVHPKSGCMILNDPENPKIKEYADRGFIIRTRADSGTLEARNNDYSRFETAKNSGAQIITTDYYLPSKLFDSSYKVIFDNGNYVEIQ